MSKRTLLNKKLTKAGYELVRSKKHFVYKNDKGSTVIVPNHNKISKHIINKILKDIEVA